MNTIGLSSVIRRLAGTAGVCILAGATLLAAAPAQAERVGPGVDGISSACRSLQDQADALIRIYGLDSTSNEEREQILTELRSLGTTWIQIGCKAAYGNIEIALPVLPKAPAHIPSGPNKLR